MVVATGCGGGSTKGVEEPRPQDEKLATKQARDHVNEVYSNIRTNGPDGLRALVDPAVMVIGPGPSQIFTDREGALVALGQVAAGNEKHKLASTDLKVSASPAGHSAWASDVIMLDGKRYAVAMVMTEADGLWTVTAVQVGVPIAGKDLAKLAKKGMPAPTPAPAPATGDAKDVAQVFKAGAASPQAMLDQMGDGFVVVRDVAGKAMAGRKAIAKAWKKQQKGVTTAVHGDVHARIAPDGTLGWAYGTVDVGKGKDPAVPTRMLHVYEKNGAGWTLVLAQPAVAHMP